MDAYLDQGQLLFKRQVNISKQKEIVLCLSVIAKDEYIRHYWGHLVQSLLDFLEFVCAEVSWVDTLDLSTEIYEFLLVYAGGKSQGY